MIFVCLQNAVNRQLMVLFDGDIKGVFNGEIDFVKLLYLETDLFRDPKLHQMIKFSCELLYKGDVCLRTLFCKNGLKIHFRPF